VGVPPLPIADYAIPTLDEMLAEDC